MCVGGRGEVAWVGMGSVCGYMWQGCVAVRILLLGPMVDLQKWFAPPIWEPYFSKAITCTLYVTMIES